MSFSVFKSAVFSVSAAFLFSNSAFSLVSFSFVTSFYK
ncbi:putative membrane protein [Helicobacter pylori Hp A-5]|nr:putative membrane protein [Helicobacter pylori Hp A-5]